MKVRIFSNDIDGDFGEGLEKEINNWLEKYPLIEIISKEVHQNCNPERREIVLTVVIFYK